jgi:AraC-like DNA-binding protein
MKLYIKNMVCSRCKMVVKDELLRQGLHPLSVELGEAEISEDLNAEQKLELDNGLLPFGFQLIDDKKSRLIEKIKNILVEIVHYSEEQLKTNLSVHLSQQVHHDYNYLSKIFSEVQGTTIEKYFIAQKIERVKELLVYDELTLNEIAYKLNYSSTSHLSKQFKKVTGLTPSHFKRLRENKRNPLEEL